MGCDDLLERERPGDDRREARIGEPLVDEPLPALQAGGVGGDFEQRVTTDRQPVSQDIEEGQRRRLRTQGAVEEQRSEASHRLDELLDRGPADRVENDPGPLAARGRHDLADQILLVGNHHVGRAGAPQVPRDLAPHAAEAADDVVVGIGIDHLLYPALLEHAAQLA